MNNGWDKVVKVKKGSDRMDCQIVWTALSGSKLASRQQTNYTEAIVHRIALSCLVMFLSGIYGLIFEELL